MSLVRSAAQRRSLPLALLLSLLLFLGACGGSATPVPTASPTTVAPSATVAPVTPTTAAAVSAATPTVAAPTVSPTRPAPATPGLPVTPGSPVAVLPPVATAIPPTATAIPPTATPVPRVGQPVRLKIPVIKVDADIEYVGLTPDGAMDVPKDYSKTAWYAPGPRPGDQGNSAIAGHVDSKTGKAVFWDLPKLKAGDEVFVVGDDGAERRFVVTGRESYKRVDAPLQRIFGPTTDRHLNLITCDVGSGFDRATSEYGGNVVVYLEYVP